MEGDQRGVESFQWQTEFNYTFPVGQVQLSDLAGWLLFAQGSKGRKSAVVVDTLLQTEHSAGMSSGFRKMRERVAISKTPLAMSYLDEF
ncbi:hypothetical protein Ddc_11944 [Ditylenchus destructor]|nr:hypothetical protein Ddc_11944 [Ditylenchus destructor]